jgi:drug/metabolite transporter (DMT)-like permease
MEEILGNIYSLFESLYGKPLSDYMWGYNCSTQNYDLELRYNQFGVIAIISALIIPPIYYYFWNPVRHQQIKYWGLLLITGLINFAIAYYILNSDIENGLVGDCMLFDNRGYQVINTINIVMFGLINCLFTCVLFLITSFAYKWGSKSVKHYPF